MENSIQTSKQQPHNLEAEKAVIACCLMGEDSADVIVRARSAELKPDDFFKTAHELIFAAIYEMDESGIPAEAFNNIELLQILRKKGVEEEVGGVAAIFEIEDIVDTPMRASEYIKIVKEASTGRKAIRACRLAVEHLYEASDSPSLIAARLESQMQNISTASMKDTMREIKEVGEEYTAQLMKRLNGDEDMITASCQTHLGDLNAILPQRGFLPGNMIVLGARPAIGKTSLAMGFVDHCGVQEGGNVLVFTLEMTPPELFGRLACARASVDAKEIDDRILSGASQKALAKAIKELKDANIWIEESKSSDIHAMRAKARMIANKCRRKGEKLNLVVIDYLQLIPGSDARLPREQQIAEISRFTKIMAGEIDAPVVILSQLNRSSEKDNRPPRLSDLRESGSIEQDADIVFLLHPNSRGNTPDTELSGTAEVKLIHAKVRNGPVGDFLITFRKRFARYENWSDVQ